MTLLYGNFTSRILRCAFDVYNQVGPCFGEDVYQRAMKVALENEGLRWVRQCPVDIHYEDVLVGRGLIDILVENRIVLELKAVEDLHRAFTKQVLKYLWAGDFQLGLVLNFGSPERLQWRRVILDKSRYGVKARKATR